ncbi:fimbrial biogenesis chaperone [Sphingomonas agri]|uniref:fimbrial biogenesis chaperone n=1 Tax=Sphingomonas agri TaxID=1813878 RepID=UPI00311E875C
MSKFHRLVMLPFALASFAWAAPASADLVLSELIVELQPAKQVRDDVEIWNNSPERSYVAVEPREILNPGRPSQSERKDPDPQKLGLLVSPSRMILEPGQRKLVRMAMLSSDADKEHVYRVTVKPVVGGIQSSDTGLKVVIGYDVLVLVRPAQPAPRVTALRKGRELTFSNSGNVSVEVIEGRQCPNARAQCAQLPGKRLYPGASWTVELPSDLPAQYVLKSPGRSDRATY